MLAVVEDGRAVRQVLQLALLQGWQHASEDFEPQVVLVAQAVGAALDHPDLVVEPLDEAERNFVVRPGVGGDAVPMTNFSYGLRRCQRS